ncbi:MAG: hypothetical protein ACI9K2_005117 [Myxococcota bacterium]|jgi:hypothetical protein
MESSQEQIKAALATVPEGCRHWFAIGAAARLVQRVGSSADPAVTRTLSAALTALTAWPEAETSELQARLAECEELEQDEDAHDYDSDPLLDNAVAATCYAIEAAMGDAEAPVWAAIQAYEAVDYLAHTELAADFNDAEQMARVASHPVVLAEKKAQHDDLDFLAQHQEAARIAVRVRRYLV